MIHIPPIGAIIAANTTKRNNDEEARKKREAILRTRREKQILDARKLKEKAADDERD